MRLLVCGGRTFADQAQLDGVLAALRPSLIIHGGAAGADRLAGLWAARAKVPVEVYFAKWSEYGPAAGHIRNTTMLTRGKPDMVVCFAGGKGTANMRRQALAAGVLTLTVAPL